MSGLTDVENDILHCLNIKIANREKITLQQLADECHVAKSTIVKFSKKLGYSGFVEMYYQMQIEEKNHLVNEGILDTLTNHLQEDMTKMVELLFEFRHCKNFVNSYGRDDMLSAYISRKLMMFDFFAPSTYDFGMVDNVYLTKGMGIFCDLRENHPFDAKDILKLAKKQGYYILAISDKELTWTKEYADYFIQINYTEYKTADFYTAKVIMFFEMVLSEFSKKYYVNKRKNVRKEI